LLLADLRVALLRDVRLRDVLLRDAPERRDEVLRAVLRPDDRRDEALRERDFFAEVLRLEPLLERVRELEVDLRAAMISLLPCQTRTLTARVALRIAKVAS
jgi:hypothetical protein